MPVCPIDYGRYGHRDMVRLFEEEYRHALWLRIEATVAEVQAELGIIPSEAAEDIIATARPEVVTLERTMEIEALRRHDVAALYEAIAEECQGPGRRWVHYGLTSNDVKDTALALQLRAAFDVLLPQVDALCDTLARRAEETVDLVAVGRSHGQHAVPITYGIRFAVWLDELRRHRLRLLEARHRAVVGKVAGATGSHAALGPVGLEMQDRVLTRLGLGVPIATTQIVQRDRHAEAVLTLANLAATLDKIATDIRSLQRTEIGEVAEPFARGEQVGSSAMPHKRNPVTCEKICGIARLIRSLATPALENVVSWEERDISHSSTERFVIPQSFILTDYIVREMTRVIEGLTIYTDRVAKNLEMTRGMIFSEYVVTALTQAGVERPVAHEILREVTARAEQEGVGLIDAAASHPRLRDIIKHLSLDTDNYYESIRAVSRTIVENAITAYRDDIWRQHDRREDTGE